MALAGSKPSSKELPEGPVAGSIAVVAVGGSTVVGGEDDDGVVQQTGVSQSRHHAAH